jgi:hypothetical protein
MQLPMPSLYYGCPSVTTNYVYSFPNIFADTAPTSSAQYGLASHLCHVPLHQCRQVLTVECHCGGHCLSYQSLEYNHSQANPLPLSHVQE